MKEQSIAQGKTIIVAVICVYIFAEAIALFLRLNLGVPLWGFFDLVRDGLISILLLFLYQGREWARLLVVLGTLFAACVYLYTLYVGLGASSLFTIYVGLMGAIIFGACAVALTFSRGVAEFMQYQRSKRR